MIVDCALYRDGGRQNTGPLAVEDAQNFHLRPEIERYEQGGVLFAVFGTARYVEEREEVDVGEVSVFLSRRFVITVRQRVASDLHGSRLRLEERPALLREGTAAILWAILDTIVDDYAPVIEGLERDVEEVEETVSVRRHRPSGSTCCAAKRRISTAPSTRCSPRSFRRTWR